MRKNASKAKKQAEEKPLVRYANNVSKSESAHPRYPFVVRWPGANGKRLVKWFGNDTDATNWAKARSEETGKSGSDFGTVGEDERGALAFWRKFAATVTPSPPALRKILEEYADRWERTRSGVTVENAFDRFIADREAEQASPRHVRTLKGRVGRFVATRKDNPVAMVTTDDVTTWLNALTLARGGKGKVSLVTRDNCKRSLHSFFAFCLERKWIVSNPVPTARKKKTKSARIAKGRKPGIMPPADVERFMHALSAAALKLVAFWAVKFWAGLRDAEAAAIDWRASPLPGSARTQGNPANGTTRQSDCPLTNITARVTNLPAA